MNTALETENVETAITETAAETTVIRPAPDTLNMRRYYAAPVALMWRLWTDPTHFARWWGPKGAQCTRCEIDLRPGGAWLTTLNTPDCAMHTVSGVYIEITEPERLVYTWGWHGEDGRGHESTVTVTFQAMGEGCEVQVLHQGLGPDEAGTHQTGWTSAFDCLADLIAETQS